MLLHGTYGTTGVSFPSLTVASSPPKLQESVDEEKGEKEMLQDELIKERGE